MTRARLIAAGAVVAALVLAFALGRYTRPAVVTDQKTATTATKSIAASSAVVVAQNDARAEKDSHSSGTADVETKSKTLIRWLPAVPAKDGCLAIPAHVEQETTVETHAATTRTADSHGTSAKASKLAAQSNHAEAAESQSTIVTLHTEKFERPRLSLTALVGAQKGGERLLDAVPAPVVVGLGADFRLIGPVSVGGIVTTAKAGFVIVRVDY